MMTKAVRIENADMSYHKLVVETWDKGAVGNPDTLAFSKVLEYPTAMAGHLGDLYVTSTRYIVIRELV